MRQTSRILMDTFSMPVQIKKVILLRLKLYEYFSLLDWEVVDYIVGFSTCLNLRKTNHLFYSSKKQEGG